MEKRERERRQRENATYAQKKKNQQSYLRFRARECVYLPEREKRGGT